MKKVLLPLFLAVILSAGSRNCPFPKTAAKETFIETNHAKLFCRVMGTGEPMIILHGGPGLSQEYLLPQMSQLAKEQRLIFYDQRGSGRSEGGVDAEDVNMNVFIDDLEAIRKAFGFKKISLLGHSMGGFVAMHYAIAHPEAIARLILMNPVPACFEDYALFEQEYVRRTAPYREELERIEKTEGFLSGDPKIVEDYLKIICRTYCVVGKNADHLNLRSAREANRNWLKTTAILATPFDIRRDLKKLSCKTLIVHGDQDPIPLSTAENLHKNIPNSKLVVLRDCGHFPHVEKPKELFETLNAFFHDALKD